MWKNIPNWEGLYQINEYGEVKNCKTNKLVTGDVNNSGYYRICLYNKPRKERFFRHRLVAMLFLENPNNYPEVNHKDENKANNHVDNLEWCTRRHNEHENRRSGGKKYTPFKVYFNNGSVKTYEFTPQLAEELKVTKRTILNWLHGKSKGFTKYNIKYLEYI